MSATLTENKKTLYRSLQAQAFTIFRLCAFYPVERWNWQPYIAMPNHDDEAKAEDEIRMVQRHSKAKQIFSIHFCYFYFICCIFRMDLHYSTIGNAPNEET